MTEIIKMLSEAPDGQLAKPLADECKKYLAEGRTDEKEFLIQLRDKAVHTGGASSFVMQMFNIDITNEEV